MSCAARLSSGQWGRSRHRMGVRMGDAPVRHSQIPAASSRALIMGQRLTKGQQQDEDQQQPRDLLSLPDDLLRICLSAPPLEGDRRSSRAALASCKSLARALAHTTLTGVCHDVEHAGCAVRAAKLLQQLWGEEEGQQQGKDFTMVLFNECDASLGPYLSALRDAGVRLPFITELHLQGLTLDAVVPSGLGALLPNLRCLILAYCQLTPAPRTTVLDCPNLQHVIIEVLSVNAPKQHQQAVTTAQLRQLAKLPSLSHVRLADSSCPTLFLAALGTQLTRLRLHASYQQRLPHATAFTPGWKTTLGHVARCTNLRELAIPCCSAEELRLMAPALQRVRTLRLHCSAPSPTDGDAMMEALLGLPHLTSLFWHACATSPFRRSYNDPRRYPCRWERLELGAAHAHQLARLPLHSLKEPFQWQALFPTEHKRNQVSEVRAMMANLTRGCPAGFLWKGRADGPSKEPELWLRFIDDVPAALAALEPLFAFPTPFIVGDTFGVGRVDWEAEDVQALGRVLPHTCTRLRLHFGAAPRDALEQLAMSLPWLRQLELINVLVLPAAMVGYVGTIKRLRAEQGKAVALERVVVSEPACFEGVGAAQCKRGWEEAARQVARLRAGVELVLDLP